MCLCDSLESVGSPDTIRGSPCLPALVHRQPWMPVRKLGESPSTACVYTWWPAPAETHRTKLCNVKPCLTGSKYHLLLEKAREFSCLTVSKMVSSYGRRVETLHLCFASIQSEIYLLPREAEEIHSWAQPCINTQESLAENGEQQKADVCSELPLTQSRVLQPCGGGDGVVRKPYFWSSVAKGGPWQWPTMNRSIHAHTHTHTHPPHTSKQRNQMQMPR